MGFLAEFFEYGAVLFLGLLVVSVILYGPMLLAAMMYGLWQFFF